MRREARKRIVITGIGVVSPLGIGKEMYWQSLQQAKTGFRPITLFNTSDLNVKVAGEITGFDPKEILGKKGLIDIDRATALLLSAVKFSLEDAGLVMTEENAYETGISIGTTFGSLNSLSEFDQQSLEEGPHFVNASRFPNTVVNSPASRSAIRYSLKGPNSTLSTGFCAAFDALEYSINCINSGRARRMISGTVEEMCIQTFLGFYKLGYLSGINGNDPVSRPFDKRRDGIIFSEGSAVFVLEELGDALKRNACIYAEIIGFSSNFSPFRLHKFDRSAKGVSEAMRSALENAQLNPEDIKCIFANANSTQDADLAEAKAIKEVFGKRAKKIPVSAIKSMVGETFSAAGGFGLSAALGGIKQGFIPPTVNASQHDPECDLDHVPDIARQQKIDNAMINCFGANGSNSVFIIGTSSKGIP